MEAKVKFAEYIRDPELVKVNGKVPFSNKSVEQLFTEAVLMIQQNTGHRIIFQEITRNDVQEGPFFGKKKSFHEIALKVVIKVPVEVKEFT